MQLHAVLHLEVSTYDNSHFFARMEQLNSYLTFLPCNKDCPSISTVATERMNVIFNEYELAGIVLNCFPKRYENQYYLNSGTVPEQLDLLHTKMTQIERVLDSAQKRTLTLANNKGKEKAASSKKTCFE